MDASQPVVPNPASTSDATAADADAAKIGGSGGDANATTTDGSNNSNGGAASSDPAVVPAPNTAKPPPPSPPPAAAAPPTKRAPALLGAQLTHGPLLLDLGGNPLGTSGSLQVPSFAGIELNFAGVECLSFMGPFAFGSEWQSAGRSGPCIFVAATLRCHTMNWHRFGQVPQDYLIPDFELAQVWASAPKS
eukprot:1157126-Pelagomonas_calceolata.AAC.11